LSQQNDRRRFRRAATTLAAAALTLGISATITTPATASGSYTGRAYVHGTSYLTGDLNDEGVVNVRTHRSSNVTCLWQMILHSDNYLPASGVDGIFGDQTHAATVKWQRDHGLTPDGSVGKLTFAKVNQKIRDTGPDGDYRYGHYDGTHHNYAVRRARSGGNWQFASPGRGFLPAAYNYRSC